jgi:hypothetical protein
MTVQPHLLLLMTLAAAVSPASGQQVAPATAVQTAPVVPDGPCADAQPKMQSTVPNCYELTPTYHPGHDESARD